MNNDNNKNNSHNEEIEVTKVEQVEICEINENQDARNEGTGKKKERIRKSRSESKNRILAFVLTGMFCATVGGTAGAVTVGTMMSEQNVAKEQKKVESGSNSGVSDTNSGSQTIQTSNNTSGNLTVAQITEKVGPAVVGVSVKGFPQKTIYGEEMPSFEGIGSGVIFDEQGYILTNYHVVEDVVQSGGTVNIIFNNGQEVAAKVVNYEQSFDIAVLKITDDVEVPGVAEFGDSDQLVPGELAVAIGNPLGAELLGSVTTGIISAMDRNIDNGDVRYIQTDAAINPGNSGGPLINSKGQVIGINTAKKVGEGVEGLGFAVPINQVKPLLENLMKPVLHIGISALVVDEEVASRTGLPLGVYVSEVSQLSPGERAGLRPGDVITEMDGKPVKNMDDINAVKDAHEDGDVVKVVVDRNGENITLELQFTALNP